MLFVVFVFGLSVSPPARAVSPPNVISYQGRVLNANGVPVSDASVSMKFEIYSAASGGTCLWSNSSTDCDSNTPASTTARTVTLTDGLFTARLGDTSDTWAAIADSLFADNATPYLQVYIAGESLTPRKAIDAVPYALNAETLDGLSSADFDLDQVYANDSDKILNVDTTDLEFSLDASGLDFIVDMQSDGNFVLQDVGTAFFTIGEDRGIVYNGNQTTATATTWQTDQLTTGTGHLYSADALTTGILMDLASSSSSITTATLLRADHTATYTSGTTSYTAKGLNAIRNITADGASTTVNLDGPFITIGSSAATANGGAVTETGSLFEIIQNNTAATGTSFVIDANQAAGSALSIDSEATTANAMQIIADVLTTGSALRIIGSDFTDDSGLALEIDTKETTATADILVIETDVGTANNTIFRIEADGEVFSDIGFTAGAFSTNYLDGELQTTGDYLFDIDGGDLTFDQNTVIGDGGDALTINSNGTLTIDDTILAATGALDLRSGGGAHLTLNSASNIVSTASGDDFAVGTTSLAAAFSVDDSLNAVRVGDGSGTNGSIALYSSAGDTGSISYNTSDHFLFSDGSARFTHDVVGFVGGFANDGNLDSHQGMYIQGCLDTNPTAACNLLEFRDGNGTILGAVEGDGAGGVTTAAVGSDYAELFDGTYADFSEGDVVALNSSGHVVVASNPSDVIGALSIAPNTLGNWVENWRDLGTYVPVALLGQVPVTVNTEGGSIAIGDYVALSSIAGVAKKATGVGYVLGRALEAHSAGTGTIEVFIQPGWHGVDVLTDEGGDVAISSALRLLGDIDETREMTMFTDVTDSSDYRLSIQNADEDEVAFINHEGDFAIAGRLYPSDRGTLQTDKYIYYDGSSGPGGDFMRTNASGWGSGSYDFAEMFPSSQSLEPGEIVVFADNEEHVMRSDGVTYDQRIAGIVSTQPGFLAGDNIAGHVPVALSGRVPTYVSGENGDIAIGDPLTTSSRAGYAMKATQAGPIVGYAMESFVGETGVVSVFVRPSYFDGGKVDDDMLANNIISELATTATLDLSGTVNFNTGQIISISAITGVGQQWSVDIEGTIRTKGDIVQIVRSHQGEDVETYPTLSRQHMIQLSGTAELKNETAAVNFEHEDPLFNDIVASGLPYRVFLTANAPTGPLYAVNRDDEGFSIREVALGEERSYALVDWMVMAYHKDYIPGPELEQEDAQEAQEDDALDEESVSPTQEPSQTVSEEENSSENLETVQGDAPEVAEESTDNSTSQQEVTETVQETKEESVVEADEVVSEQEEEVIESGDTGETPVAQQPTKADDDAPAAEQETSSEAITYVVE